MIAWEIAADLGGTLSFQQLLDGCDGFGGRDEPVFFIDRDGTAHRIDTVVSASGGNFGSRLELHEDYDDKRGARSVPNPDGPSWPELQFGATCARCRLPWSELNRSCGNPYHRAGALAFGDDYRRHRRHGRIDVSSPTLPLVLSAVAVLAALLIFFILAAAGVGHG